LYEGQELKNVKEIPRWCTDFSMSDRQAFTGLCIRASDEEVQRICEENGTLTLKTHKK
jgi:hypothetical protein